MKTKELQLKINVPAWQITAITGYEPKTTYWQDFSIADVFVLNGVEPDAVNDTHLRSWCFVKEGKVETIAEYVMVLNWKLWEHYDRGNQKLYELYRTLWEETDEWARDNLKDEALQEYYRITD